MFKQCLPQGTLRSKFSRFWAFHPFLLNNSMENAGCLPVKVSYRKNIFLDLVFGPIFATQFENFKGRNSKFQNGLILLFRFGIWDLKIVIF